MALSYAHLRGLTAVVDAREKHRKRFAPDDELDDELANRYLVLYVPRSFKRSPRLTHPKRIQLRVWLQISSKPRREL